ncbi:SDR family NAD(P)-dependent oxidoreductase [Paenibacillus harenae]|uniref:SDR family NAD(P)-dependent oxidoreductase n=1 Tax=Paenibacillus harenae TaxID=306543 RepID=UPI00041832DE|nr:SDR family oxidoreductase [Paenibacillus harenae]
MKLHDKVVFVTDADNDSGRAVTKRLAAAGASFILNSGSGGSLLADELHLLRQAGLKTLVVNVDLSKSSETAAMLDYAEEQLGAVDILVFNSSFVHRASVEDCEEVPFVESLRVNAKSAFICTQAVGRQMQQRQSGRIIYISSIHAEKPTGSSFAFSVSKGAVKMLAKEAAIVLGRNGVCVNTIELGPLKGDDEIFQSTFSTLYRDYEYKVPNAVLGTADDLAELVLFLSSDAARYINGSDIRLDGGFLLHYMNFKMKRP